MKQRSSRHFLFETLPKEGNKREREPTKHTCSILQPPRSFWTSAVQDGPLTSCCTTQNTIPHHAHTPRSTLSSSREIVFTVSLLDWSWLCFLKAGAVATTPPMTGSEGWWLSVSAFCARLYSFCSRAAFANLRRCETDPRKSPPNTISSHDMWEKDRKRRPHLPVFALRSSSDHKWMQSAGSTTSKGQWIQLVKSCAASEFGLETAGGWLSGFGKFLKCWMCWWFSREQDGTRWNKHSHSWSAGVPPRWLEGVTAVPPERERLLMVPWDMLGRVRNVSNLMVLFTFKMTEGRMDRRASSKPPIYNNWNQIRWYCPSDTLNEWMNEMKWNEMK